MKRMLYHAGRFMCAAFLLAGGLTACSDDDPAPGPDNTDQREPLATPVLTSSNIAQNSFTVSWKGVAGASVYGYTIDGTGAEGEELEYTMETSAIFSGLQPGTTHVVRVQAVPASDSEEYKASAFGELTVTTEGEDPDFFTFETLWVQPSGAGIKVTPRDNETTWFVINASKDGLDFKNLDEYIADYKENNFWLEPGQSWLPDGYSLFAGEGKFEDFVNLMPERDYVLIGAAVDIRGNVIKTGTYEYATPAIGPVDCTFEVVMGDVSYDIAWFQVFPSDPYALYTVDVVPATEYAGKTDEQIIEAMMQKDWLQYYHGPQDDGNVGITFQDTDYVICVVGCVQQQPTTALHKTTFRSGRQDFDYTGDAYTEVEMIWVEEVTADWGAGMVKGAFKCTPNASTKVYRTVIGPASKFENMTDEEIGKLIDEEQDKGEWHNDGIWVFDADKQIPVGTEGMVIILSRDRTGKSGRLNKLRFTANPMGENPYPGGGEPPIIG